MKPKKTLIDFPEIYKEFYSIKNGNLKPENIVQSNRKIFWWKCKNNHEWKSTVVNRIRYNSTCPICRKQEKLKNINLEITHPEIAKEWHYEKNFPLTPKDVTYGVAKKLWWQCSKIKEHIYQTTCSHKTCHKAGCPYCSNRKLCKENCLETKFPEIAKEFHPTKNGNLTPKNIIAGSIKKVWWICKENHEWTETVTNRTSNPDYNCPFCSNHKVCKDNCLSTTHPELCKQWDYEKNGKLTPEDVVAGSQKKVWWICKNNPTHKWKTQISVRTIGYKCPYCNGKKACFENCLKTKFPEIAKEWDYERNGNLTPENITYGSGKKVWWKCSKGHSWNTQINKRTNGKSCCPICNESHGEKEVERILIKNNFYYKRQYKISECKNINPLPFDFAVKFNHKDYLIEYHGGQHYKPCNFGSKKISAEEKFSITQRNDKIKADFCKQNNIKLLTISYKDYNNIENLLNNFLI